MAIVTHTCGGGMQAIVSAAEGTATSLYISVGTGAGTAATTDTSANCTEDTTSGRQLCTLTKTTTTNTNDTITATVAAFNFAVNETLTEIMIWDAASSGHLLAHSTGYSIPVGAGNNLASGQLQLNIQEIPQ